MELLAEAELLIKEVERDSNKLRSPELRQAIQEYVEAQKKRIRALRRLVN